MVIFSRAQQVVRLRSIYNNYLTADADRIHVRQEPDGNSDRARWTVQFITDDFHEPRIYLRSCYGCWLTARDEHDIFGKKVRQTVVEYGNPSIEWHPTYQASTNRGPTVFSLQSRTEGNLWAYSRGFPAYFAVTHFQHTPWTSGFNPHNHLWDVEVLEQHEEQRHVEPDGRTSSPPTSVVDNVPPPPPREIIVASPARQVPNQTTSAPSSSGTTSSGRVPSTSSSGRTPFFPGSASPAEEAVVGGNVDSSAGHNTGFLANGDTGDAAQLRGHNDPTA